MRISAAHNHYALCRKTCLAPMRQQPEQIRLKIRDFYPQVNTYWVDEHDLRRYDTDLTAFVNVNTPEALRAAELSLHRPISILDYLHLNND